MKFTSIKHPTEPWSLVVRSQQESASETPLEDWEILLLALDATRREAGAEIARLTKERDESSLEWSRLIAAHGIPWNILGEKHVSHDVEKYIATLRAENAALKSTITARESDKRLITDLSRVKEEQRLRAERAENERDAALAARDGAQASDQREKALTLRLRARLEAMRGALKEVESRMLFCRDNSADHGKRLAFEHCASMVRAALASDSPEDSTRKELCNRCGELVSNWVDTEQSGGRICRKCEAIHFPSDPTDAPEC